MRSELVSRGLRLALLISLLQVTDILAQASGTRWLNDLVAQPSEITEFQVGQTKARLTVHHESDLASPREGLNLFWLTFAQTSSQMRIEFLAKDADKKYVSERLKTHAQQQDIAVLTAGFFGPSGCVPAGLAIAAGDHGGTSLAEWIEKDKNQKEHLIGGVLVSRGPGELSIERSSEFESLKEEFDPRVEDAVQSKPLLVMDGRDDQVANDNLSNRIAVGLNKHNEIVIIGATRKDSQALTLHELVSALLIPESQHGPGAISMLNMEGAHAQVYIPSLPGFNHQVFDDSQTCTPTALHFEATKVHHQPAGAIKR